ncbi:hypothetical protein I6A84_05800 [Frankia sp. CNm7]|nr:hypothetical protein [Frankia nepalensis]MBL7517650.1 hypothetical protein [Frankia nepalensis]
MYVEHDIGALVDLLTRGEDRAMPLSYHFRGQRTGLDDSTPLAARPELVVDSVDDLLMSFRAGRAKQLSIIGGPGCGKTTTLALLILRSMTEKAEKVPVRISLAGWSPRVFTIEEWIERRIVSQYPGMKKDFDALHADHLLRIFVRKLVIPLLDGLDEAGGKVIDEASDAISHTFVGGRPVIATCRTREFMYLSRKPLPGGSIAIVRPLQREVMRTYLVEADGRWAEALTGALGATTAAQERVLCAPLMAWLAAEHDGDPRRVINDTKDSTGDRLKDRLLDGLVTSLYRRGRVSAEQGGSRQGSDARAALRWLSFLAEGMQRRPLHEVAWWQITALAPTQWLGLSSALGAGALLGLLAPRQPVLAVGLLLSLYFGLVCGVSFGRGYSMSRSNDPEERRRGRTGYSDLESGNDPGFVVHLQRVGAGVIYVLAAAVLAGLVMRVPWWSDPSASDLVWPGRNPRQLLIGLAAGTLAAAFAGFAAATVIGLRLQANPDEDTVLSGATAMSAKESFVRDLKNAGTGTALAGVLAGAFVVPAVLWFWIDDRLAFGWIILIAVANAVAAAPGLVLRPPARTTATDRMFVRVRRGLAGVLACSLGATIIAWSWCDEVLAPAWISFWPAGITSCLMFAASTRNAVAWKWLAFRKKLPTDLFGSLEEAHDLGVLRQAGIAYEFRHDLLRQALVARAKIKRPAWVDAPRAVDIVVFGAPGSRLDPEGRLQISPAAAERAQLAADYWHHHNSDSDDDEYAGLDPECAPRMRVICVAGRPGKRQMMADVGDQAEAQHIARLVVEQGVPQELVIPNPSQPLGRAYATSTVDEVGILVEEGLTPIDKYSRAFPLAVVAHRHHGLRIRDVWRKVGFRREQILPVPPEAPDSRKEIALRLAYQLFVLGLGTRIRTTDRLREREEELHRVVSPLRRAPRAMQPANS